MMTSILMVCSIREVFVAKAKLTQNKSVAAKGNGKDKSATLARALFLELYQKMLEIRRFEEKVGQLYGMG